jgi:flagellum-specific peptidoglycan hydrolase FlgJ
MEYKYNLRTYSPKSVQQLTAYIDRHWFQIMVMALGIYVLFFKNISIQVNMHGATGVEQAVIVSPEGTKPLNAEARAVPAAYRPQNISTIAPQPAKQPQKDARIANTFSNLTFVLSPDYGERHNVDPAIVRQKVDYCKGYVRKYLSQAKEERRKYGIPVSITLAQGLLESNVGDSRLAKESNNHFGIKCRRKCRGCTCRNYSDDDIYDMFRVFESVGESYREHSLLLTGSRYKHLLKLPKSDYVSWAHGLKKAGYATDKRYAQKLIQIIEFLGLHRYDQNA